MFSFQNDFSCACLHNFFSYGNLALAKLFDGRLLLFLQTAKEKGGDKSPCPAQELEYIPRQERKGGQTKLLHLRL